MARWLGREQWQSFAEEEGLANPSIWRIVRDAAGDLWIGTSRGLFRGAQEGGRWRFRPTDAVGELSVYGLAAEADGSLWVGTFKSGANGLVRYNPRTGQRLVYPPPEPVAKFSINEIDRDDTGTVWVATPQGRHAPPAGRQAARTPAPALGRRPGISDVRSTKQGLFVACNKGLYIQQGQMRRLLTVADGLKDNAVQSVAIGPDGALWIAYFSSGGDHPHRSPCRKPATAALYHRGRSSERRGLLPVFRRTRPALARYRQRRRQVSMALAGCAYDTSDGLVWNDCNAHAYLAGGRRYLLGGNQRRPRPLFPGGPAKSRPAGNADHLRASQRSARPEHGIRFLDPFPGASFHDAVLPEAGGEFPLPDRHRIESRGSKRKPGRSVSPNFRPGIHRFEVQGEAEPGVWTSSAIMQFRIRPPWFRTWQFQAGLFVSLAGFLWWWWQQREIRQQ